MPAIGAILTIAAGAAAPLTGVDAAQAPIVVVASPLGEHDADTVHPVAVAVPAALPEQLARTTPGVSINEMQGNPLQVDVNYRGFTASPLAGTPQGLSVYLDGVRINQPFAEVVNWDLIPMAALAEVELVPGAAPQFGRNALGGVLVLRTRSGKSDPGAALEASAGSFGRVTGTAQWGGTADNGLHWFALADHFRESGWRALSPSRATRAFAKLGWSGARSEAALTGLFADSNLNGNGLQEMRLLEADRTSIYTAPDNTRARHWLAELKGGHTLSDTVRISANAFWRRTRSQTYNGDINDDALAENVYQPSADERAALAAAGYTGFPLAGESRANTPFPRWRCIANVLLNDEPNEKCNALANRSLTTQHEWGLGAELVLTGTLAGLDHTMTLGLAYVNNRASFGQGTQFGYLLADRTVMPVDGPGAFADGTQASEDAFDARVDLGSRSASLGLYALDRLRLTGALRLDLAARFDRTSVHNRDRITPGGGTGSLDSDPVFQRLNPGATLVWTPGQDAELALAWSQASRAPSAVELGCSDPASPCRLPNALAGDPPLRQVIARTVEARAQLRRKGWSLRASVFRTAASDDILFVTDDPSGYGYFRNFGQTRRQGLELAGSAVLGRVTLSASYALLDATFRSPEVVGGAANSSNDGPGPGFEGNIAVRPGDRIPLLPRHQVKAALEWTPVEPLTLTLDMVAASASLARGNENGGHRADGVYHLGPGQSGGYAVFNAGAALRPWPGVTLFATVRNLLNRRYATAAQLGPAAFDPAGSFVAQPFAGPVIDGERPLVSSTFYAPGAPRSVQVGLRAKL